MFTKNSYIDINDISYNWIACFNVFHLAVSSYSDGFIVIDAMMIWMYVIGGWITLRI